jgi:hypothetical protein
MIENKTALMRAERCGAEDFAAEIERVQRQLLLELRRGRIDRVRALADQLDALLGDQTLLARLSRGALRDLWLRQTEIIGELERRMLRAADLRVRGFPWTGRSPAR